jgi:hypothetical protein
MQLPGLLVEFLAVGLFHPLLPPRRKRRFERRRIGAHAHVFAVADAEQLFQRQRAVRQLADPEQVVRLQQAADGRDGIGVGGDGVEGFSVGYGRHIVGNPQIGEFDDPQRGIAAPDQRQHHGQAVIRTPSGDDDQRRRRIGRQQPRIKAGKPIGMLERGRHRFLKQFVIFRRAEIERIFNRDFEHGDCWSFAKAVQAADVSAWGWGESIDCCKIGL